VLAVIELDKGDLKFQVPHGDTPDAMRNRPLLAGMNIPKTGQNGSVGLAVSKTLAIAGDPQMPAGHRGVRVARRGAYNRGCHRFLLFFWKGRRRYRRESPC
jgi:quinoprotein glucose dehydrogenase